MKKRNRNIFLVIIGIVSLLVACFFVANSNKYSEERIAGDSTVGYYDFSALKNVPGAVYQELSYGTVFLSADTQFIVEQRPGYQGYDWDASSGTWVANSTSYTSVPDDYIEYITVEGTNIQMPRFKWFNTGTLRMRVTNSATNKNGEMLDVIIEISDINVWKDYITNPTAAANMQAMDSNRFSLDFQPFNAYTFSTDPNTPTHSNEYTVPLKVGSSIVFYLNATRADCNFKMTYVKAGTNTVDTTIDYIPGIWYDFDVPYGSAYVPYGDVSVGNYKNTNVPFDGNEGVTFRGFSSSNHSSTSIYYNKDESQYYKYGDNSATSVVSSTNDRFRAVLLPSSDNKGIYIYDNYPVWYGNDTDGWYISGATQEGSIATDSVYYQTSINTITTQADGVFEFEYGGAGCGIGYMFGSPYPMNDLAPSKSSSSTGPFRLSDSYHYYVRQYIPNNYLATKVRFDQVQRVLSTSTNGETTSIFDEYKIHKGLVFEDILDGHLTTTQSSIKVYRNNVGGDDVTSLFDISVTTTESGSIKVTASTKDSVIDQSFYSHYYILDIPVTINKYVDQNNSTLGTYVPNNTAKTTIKYENAADYLQVAPNVDVSVKYKVVTRHYKVTSTPNDARVNEPILVSRTNEKICEDIVIIDQANHGTSFSTSPCASAIGSSSYWRFREILVKGMDKNNLNITPEVKAEWNVDGSGGTNSSGSYSNSVSDSLTDSNGVIYIDYYYERKPAIVIANYLIDDQERDQVPGCTTYTKNSFLGVSYTTPQCDPTGYEFSRMDLTPPHVPASGDEITHTPMSVVYLYKRKTAQLIVKHTPVPVKNGVNAAYANEVSTVTFGEEYNTSYKQSNQLASPYTNSYEWDQVTPSNDHGVVSAETVNANNQIVVEYKYVPQQGTYVVHHYLEGTLNNNPPESVCDDETFGMFTYGTQKTTRRCEDALTNYKQVSCDGSDTNPAVSQDITINKPLTEVTYCYAHRQSTIRTNHYMRYADGTLSEIEVHDHDEQIVNYGDRYTTNYYQSNELKADRANTIDKVFRNRYEYSGVHTGDEVEAVVDRDSYVVNYYYSPKTAYLVVHHYAEGTNTELCVDPTPSPWEVNPAYYDYSYSYTPCEHLINNSYKFKEDDSRITINAPSIEPSYIIDGNLIRGFVDQPETEIIFNYELKPSKITVHHLICTNNTKVHDDVVIDNLRYGQQYHTTDQNSDLYDDDNLGHYRNMYQWNGTTRGDPKDGIVTQDNIELTYCYDPLPVKVITHHVDKRDSRNVVHANDEQNLHYGDPYTTRTYAPNELASPYTNRYSYTGEHSGDPVSGTLSVFKSNHEYHIYYQYDLDSSEYTVKYCDCTASPANCELAPPIHTLGNHYGSPYKAEYIESSALSGEYKNNWEYSSVSTTDTGASVNQSTGVVEGTFNTERVEVTYCYVRKKATITAHYYIWDKVNNQPTTTKVHQDEIQQNVLFGTVYHTIKYNPEQLEDVYKDNYKYYKMAEDHDPAIGNVGKDNIDVIYYYERDPIILTTRHYIKGTNIEVSSSCRETVEEIDRRASYSKSKCTTLPNGYTFDNVKSNQTETVLNQNAGTASSNAITKSTTITFEYRLLGIGLTVEYYDADTNQKITGVQDRFVNHTYNDSIVERPINIDNYDYISTTVVAEGNSNPDFAINQNTGVVNGTIRENTTIKYYYRRVHDLVVHHYKKGTTESICEDEHNRLRNNATYEKNPCANEANLREYRYAGVTSSVNTSTINNMTGNVKGTITGPTTITYYYAIPEYVPDTSKTGTTTVDRRDELITYNLHYKGTVKNYVGNGTIRLVDKLPYPLDESDTRIVLDGGVYDPLSRTITWTIPWNNIDTATNGDAIKEVNKTIKVVYRDIPVTVYEITNKFDTATQLEGKTFTTEDEHTTEFNLYTLTVKHLINGTQTEVPNCPQEFTDKLNFGDSYQTKPCQNIGFEYTLKNINGDASGTINGDTVVIYNYDVTEYNYIVRHLDIDTNEELTETFERRWPHGTQYSEGTITKDRYQFVELYVSDQNATKTNDHVDGILTKDTEITFYYKKYQKLHITHVDIDRPEIVLDEETKDVPYRSNYEEYKKEFNKYEFVNVSSDDTETVIIEDKASGVIEKDINIVYRYKKQLDMNVHHYKKGTTEEICPTETELLPYNTAYEKTKCTNEELLGKYIYAYVEVDPDNNDNTVDDPGAKVTGHIKDDTVINFYYELTTIDINPKKEGPAMLHSRSKAFNYKITDTVKIKDYRGNATITIVDKLEYEIDTARSNLANGVYNNEDKTITWTIPWNNINTNGMTNDTVTRDISIEFTVYYKNVPMEVEYITNRAVENVHTEKVDEEKTPYIDTEIDPFNLVVHHYKEDTTQELCPSTNELLDEGTSYTKTKCDLDEYDYIEVKKNGTRLTGNTGTVTENISGDTTLDFIYRKKDSTIETTLTKDGPDELTAIYQEVTYDIHYEGHVIDYRGDGTVTLTDTLPYRIDTNRSNLDGGEYDGQYKITWKVNWNGIDTYNNVNDTIKVDKKIKVVYLDVNIDRKIMTNEVEAKTELADKTDLVIGTKDTEINLPGTIIVHHYLHGTTARLFDDDEATGLVHEKYHAQPHEMEGYHVVTRPEDEDIEFTIGEQVLIYTYEKDKFVIKTEVIGDGGTITGDEEVPYGGDSTPDYIVITPDDEHEVEAVYIDGSPVEEINKEGMIIDNFKDVKENHLVQVIFTEKPIEVPITGRTTRLIIAAIIVVIVNIVTAIKTGFVSKIFKKSL